MIRSIYPIYPIYSIYPIYPIYSIYSHDQEHNLPPYPLLELHWLRSSQHYWLLGPRFLPKPVTTLTKRLLYFKRLQARPVGFLAFSCGATFGVCPRTFPARASDPCTLPARHTVQRAGVSGRKRASFRASLRETRGTRGQRRGAPGPNSSGPANLRRIVYMRQAGAGGGIGRRKRRERRESVAAEFLGRRLHSACPAVRTPSRRAQTPHIRY